MGAWAESLSYTSVVKINLARAFIANADMLVLQRPFHHYDEGTSRKVSDIIRRHLDNRGLGLPQETLGMRRPRTIFYTPESMAHVEAADVLWQLDPIRKTAYEVSRHE